MTKETKYLASSSHHSRGLGPLGAGVPMCTSNIEKIRNLWFPKLRSLNYTTYGSPFSSENNMTKNIKVSRVRTQTLAPKNCHIKPIFQFFGSQCKVFSWKRLGVWGGAMGAWGGAYGERRETICLPLDLGVGWKIKTKNENEKKSYWGIKNIWELPYSLHITCWRLHITCCTQTWKMKHED